MCSAKEGCAGTDQVIGAHNVLEDYEKMLTNTTTSSQMVAATVLESVLGLPGLSTDIAASFGDVLLGNGDGGDDVLVVLYNDLAIERTEGKVEHMRRTLDRTQLTQSPPYRQPCRCEPSSSSVRD